MMLYDEITNLVQFGSDLFRKYPVFFHALVSVGTIMTAVLGIMNTRHIKKQANLQREIEGNRYKIELFDKRFKVYENYKPSVMNNEIIPNITSEINRDQFLRRLQMATEEFSKCLLVFKNKDNGKLHKVVKFQTKMYKYLKSVSDTYIEIREQETLKHEKESEIQRKTDLIISIKDLASGNIKASNFNTQENKNIKSLNNEIKKIDEKIAEKKERIRTIESNFPARYLELCDAYIHANEYMAENLSLPELAFEEEKPGIFKRGKNKFVSWWQQRNLVNKQ